MSALFYRKNKNFINNSYTQWVTNALNVSTISKWNVKKTMKFYEKEFEEWYLWYRFNLVYEWFNDNRDDSDLDFLGRLKSIIKNLNLQEFLNCDEQNYLLQLSSQNFTKVRNIKSLLIDFEPLEDELAYFHYRHLKMSSNNFKWNDSDFYITNKRIVVIFRNESMSLYFDNINNLDYFDKHFDINYMNKIYHFYWNEPKLIQISIDRVFKMIKKDNKINGHDN